MHTGLPCVVNNHIATSYNQEIVVFRTWIFNWHDRFDAW